MSAAFAMQHISAGNYYTRLLVKMSVRYEKGQSGAGLLVPVLRNWSLFTAINHGRRGRGREKGAKIVLMNDERIRVRPIEVFSVSADTDNRQI